MRAGPHDADDDALSREKIDDVRIPVVGASIADLVTEQKLGQLAHVDSAAD